jgi:hypothetical protein
LTAVLFIVGIFYGIPSTSEDSLKEPEKQEKKVDASVPTKEVKPEVKGDKAVIKKSVLLNVPYTVQAPLANWSVHEESCEEAAVLMYHYFLSGKRGLSGNIISPYLAGSEMVKMKNWQVKAYGREPDLSIYKLGVFVRQYYGYDPKVFKSITTQDIKRELSAGHPVLVPVMTHGLRNPHYGPKSVYHILLIKGYSSGGAIANDAGIKEGQSVVYPWGTVFSAIDAQTPKMVQGRVMLVLTK